MHLQNLNTGNYLIVNKATKQALDHNTSGAQQVSHQHPRVFTWPVSANSPNHQWYVEKQWNGNYVITALNTGMSMDGNTQVPNHRSSHPSPFLYQTTPSAPNHRWKLVPTGEFNAFMIVNESNGLALDGNVNGVEQYDRNHPSPFLYTPVKSAPNHVWIFQPVGQYYPNNHYQSGGGYQNMDGSVEVACCTIL